MLPILNPEYTITRQKSTIILHDTILIGDSGTVQSISSTEAIILALYDGTRSQSDVSKVMEALGFSKNIIENVMKLTQSYIDRSILIDSRVLKNRSRLKVYDPLEFAFEVDVKPIGDRLEYPIALTYIVTRSCRRLCKYCFANAKYLNNEELISFSRLTHIIDEAHEIGINSFNISGGEPFLRPDIVNILEYILKKGIYLTVSTKEALSEDVVQRLRNAGLEDIQVSLDSPKPEIANFLVGSQNYYKEIISTIELLIKYGIKVHINCVISSYNIKQIPDLLNLAESLGVSQVAFSPYTRSLGRHNDALFLSAKDEQWLNSVMPQLRKKHNKLKIPEDSTDDSNISSKDSAIPQRSGCSVGIIGFIMLPNGEVTLCERVPYDPYLIIGNLNYQSIMEAWSSPKWDQFCYPSREQYKGTECFYCETFEACTSQKVRCLVNAMIVYGKVHAPEPTCPRIKEPDIRLA